MKKPIIEFENFSFQYTSQKEKTLKDINLTIYEGEKVLILGPSGSGKSTLSGCINGVSQFLNKGEIEGSLKIKGKNIKDSSIFELSNDVGTVLQDPDGQFIGLTVAEDIAFKLENDCIPVEEMKKRTREVSKIVGCSEYMDMPPQKLSGGQKQRVTLAGVMVSDVDILLFDEPLASLDPLTGNRAIELIDMISKESKKTIVIIEHRLEDVLHRNVDRVIIVNNGTIVADESLGKILESDILKNNGIREPLYLSALKYAGINITRDMNLENIEKLNIEGENDKIFNFYKNIEKIKKDDTRKTLLELKNVGFSYDGKKEILKDVSFKVKKGEIISILGKNGAGKSTLSKLICGFYKETQGKIFLNGQDIRKHTIRERAEYIGFVMQNPNQMICKHSIIEEVSLGLKVRGIKREEVEKRVMETLKICGLYPFRNWPISALSFGQKKRVTIASMLVLNPEILILDEPTAGQDFKHYTEIMEFLMELNKRGLTIIMITHDMHLMLEYTERAIVIGDGIKLAEDSASSILSNLEIIEKANLKRTSLYDLSKKVGFSDKVGFLESFIKCDREARENESNARIFI